MCILHNPSIYTFSAIQQMYIYSSCIVYSMSKQTTVREVYGKIRAFSQLAFVVLLGGGFIIVLSSNLTQGGVFQVGTGFGLAMASAIFVTLGLNAKNKIKELSN